MTLHLDGWTIDLSVTWWILLGVVGALFGIHGQWEAWRAKLARDRVWATWWGEQTAKLDAGQRELDAAMSGVQVASADASQAWARAEIANARNLFGANVWRMLTHLASVGERVASEDSMAEALFAQLLQFALEQRVAENDALPADYRKALESFRASQETLSPQTVQALSPAEVQDRIDSVRSRDVVPWSPGDAPTPEEMG